MKKTVFKPFKSHTGSIRTCAYSPDGAFIATGSDDATIRIWEAGTGRQVGEPLTGHRSGVNAVDFSPDGRRLVSGSLHSTLRIWDINTRQMVLGPLEGHKLFIAINAVQYSPDGAIIASAGYGLVKLWNAHTGDCIATIQHPERVNSISFSPSGDHIATGGCDDRRVRIYDLAAQSGTDHTSKYTRKVYDRGSVSAIAWFPDGKHVASAGNNHAVRIWDTTTGHESADPLVRSDINVEAIDISENGGLLASGEIDGLVCIWDLKSYDLALPPLSAASGSYDKTVRIWDSHSFEPLGEPLEHNGQEVNSLCFSPDGLKLLSSCPDGAVRVWDVLQGEKTVSVSHDSAVHCVQFSTDGSNFVIFSDIRVYRRETRTGRCLQYFRHEEKVHAAAISPDGERVLSVVGNGIIRIKLWDVKSGQLLLPKSHDGSAEGTRQRDGEGGRGADADDDSIMNMPATTTRAPAGMCLDSNEGNENSTSQRIGKGKQKEGGRGPRPGIAARFASYLGRNKSNSAREPGETHNWRSRTVELVSLAKTKTFIAAGRDRNAASNSQTPNPEPESDESRPPSPQPSPGAPPPPEAEVGGGEGSVMK
ncbi:WD40 repeat-like protein [Coniophora puteana RWD-64-598 SS2]|uniref:WD40 repeat-like protein n=1 Tax=Coniophora puteana (strain RWD-64-598) TaxID=741705 RepID=A0A5M3MHT6_CONPW|nr:WD40 repeat-like protein [Coniophora puteana RWD-64-598 SS2]EIW78191.1 WD40 repeat-like protein [Coniophora puteana RWD-64-598 SS2]